MKKLMHIFIIILSSISFSLAATVEISAMEGDVKIRKGLDEHWQTAVTGMLLEEIDTILTGKSGNATLILADGRKFRLGPEAVLDIGDLRKMKEKDLFLYLMSKKVDNLAPVKSKAKIKIGNVSVVHGSKTVLDSIEVTADTNDWYQREKNGAEAIYGNALYPNAVMKMHKILNKYDDLPDQGELYYLMAKSFESMEEQGQAIDHYEQAIEHAQENDVSDPWIGQARDALKRLNKE